MKKLIIILFLVSFTVFSQSKTDWEKEKLRGKVLSVREISYQNTEDSEKRVIETLLPNVFIRFNSEGDYLLRETYNQNNQMIEYSVFTYEKNPRMDEIRTYNSADELITTMISSIDDKGNRRDIRFYDEKNNITRNVVYKYDKKNRQIERRVVDKGVLNERFTYKYNSKDDIIEQYSYFANQTIAQKWVFMYDEYRNRTESRQYNHKNLLEKITRYQYDDKKNKISQKFFDADDNLQQEDIFSYDDFANEIFIQRKIFSNNISWQKKQEYTYDEQGNWTKKIIYINEKPVTISQREIVYFP